MGGCGVFGKLDVMPRGVDWACGGERLGVKGRDRRCRWFERGHRRRLTLGIEWAVPMCSEYRSGRRTMWLGLCPVVGRFIRFVLSGGAGWR